MALSTDPSLYCVNAWNDLSALHTIGGSPHIALRMETHPAYGWMVTREFLEELQLNTWHPEKEDVRKFKLSFL